MSAADDEVLAAEHALGLLDEATAARCEARAAADPGFAAAIEVWRRRLAELDWTAAPEPAGEALWLGIATALDESARAASSAAPVVAPGTSDPAMVASEDPAAAPDRAVAGSGPATAAPRRRSPDARRGPRLWRSPNLWRSLPFWRTAALGAAAAALLLAAGVGTLLREAARTPVLVAVLLTDTDRPAAVVNAFADGRAELVPLSAITAPAGSSLQVWTLWDRARGPVSVGLLEAMRSLDLAVEGLPPTAPEQLFEVTLEPEGGSPTGRPTGPILMKGTASRAL